MWEERDEWLKKFQPQLNSPAEASLLLDHVKQVASKHNIVLENPQLGTGDSTPNYQAAFASVETKSPWPPLVRFMYDVQQPESFRSVRKREPADRFGRSDDDARQVQDRTMVRAEGRPNHTRSMKQYAIAVAIVGVVATAALRSFGADSVPKAQSFARYEPMMQRSPFAVATAAAPIPAATPNFAKDLYIANAAKTPDGDLVTIASTTDRNFKKYLSTKTTVDGYSVPSIEWSERVGATTVTISKDGQFATLTFNQALIAQPCRTTRRCRCRRSRSFNRRCKCSSRNPRHRCSRSCRSRHHKHSSRAQSRGQPSRLCRHRRHEFVGRSRGTRIRPSRRRRPRSRRGSRWFLTTSRLPAGRGRKRAAYVPQLSSAVSGLRSGPAEYKS
jgi:hypothetical protein